MMSRFCKYAAILGVVFVIDHVTSQTNGGPPSMGSQQTNNMLLQMMGGGEPQQGQQRSKAPQEFQTALRTGIPHQPANGAQKSINRPRQPINQPKQQTQPVNPFEFPYIESRLPFMPPTQPALANNAGQMTKLFEQIQQLENGRHGAWQPTNEQPKMEPDVFGQPWTNSLAQAYMIGRMADNMELF